MAKTHGESVPSRKSGKRGGIKGLAKGGARRHRDWPPRGEPIVFVDCPDPDNFVLVVAANCCGAARASC